MAPISPAVERLYKIKDSLSGAVTGLKDEVEQRKEANESRMYELRDVIAKLEKNLNIETRKRAESDKVLQTMLDNKLNAIQEQLEKKVHEKISGLSATVDILSKRCTTLERLLADEKERNSRLMNDTKIQLATQSEEFKAAIDNERVTRMEREASILRKVGDDLLRLSDRIDMEKISREQQINSIYELLHKNDSEKVKSDSEFRKRIIEDIEILSKAIAAEAETREKVENDMASSIDSIVLSIQESLKFVSK